MRANIYWSVLSLFAVVLSTSTLSAKPVTSGKKLIRYEDLTQLVRVKNENVGAARMNVKAQEKRTGRLVRSFLPNISGQVGTEAFKPGSDTMRTQGYWKAEASLNLYRGGKDALEERVLRSNVDAATAEYALEYHNELKDARKTYWRIVAITKLIADQRENLEKNDSNLRSARRRTGAGVSTAADTLQFELHRTTLSQELKKMELERDLLLNRLSVALGQDDHESIEVQADFPKPPAADASQLSLGKIAEQMEVKALAARAESERLRHEQSSRWWLPRVDLYTSYGLPSLGDEFVRALQQDREFAAGIRLGINLGAGLQDRSEASARLLEAKALESRKQHKAREVLATNHELRHDLRLLREMIGDSDRAIGKAERFAQLTTNEYNRGVKNGPDLLSAYQNLYEFRERRINLYREYFETEAELEALLAK